MRIHFKAAVLLASCGLLAICWLQKAAAPTSPRDGGGGGGGGGGAGAADPASFGLLDQLDAVVVAHHHDADVLVGATLPSVFRNVVGLRYVYIVGTQEWVLVPPRPPIPPVCLKQLLVVAEAAARAADSGPLELN